MKYALFALGLLLLFIGAYAVYFGYGIIEVERGWASVIAGTTAFVGGLLILGVAWIIQTLEQIRAVLRANATDTNVMSGVAAYEELQDAPGVHGAAMDLPLPTAPVSWPPQTSPVYTTPALHEAVPEDMPQSLFVTEATETTQPPATASPLDIAPAPVMEQRAKPPVKALWRHFARETAAQLSDVQLAAAGPKEPGITAPAAPAQPPPLPGAIAFPAPEEPREPAPVVEHGDWLDHAFAELDASLAQTASSAVPEPTAAEPPALEPAVSEPHVSEPVSESSHPDFAAEPPPPLAHEPASPEFPFTEKPAVIGRYEAEGTNYIMYADGSIEAHSERGVAYFNSMTELKAYFETQGTPQ
jgi:hypothetical protein